MKQEDIEFKEFHDQKYLEMDPEIRRKAVEHLQSVIPEDVKAQVREAHAKNPIHWCSPYHFFWGMGIRNELRTGAGIPDNQLPSGNWDDHYVAIIEAAIGVRELPA